MRSSPRHAAAQPQRRMRWARGMVVGYGVTASLMLLAIAVIGDRTAITYLTALVFFWWLLPAPVLLLVAGALRWWLGVAAVLFPATVFGWQQGPYAVNTVVGWLDTEPAELRVATFNITEGAPTSGLVSLARDHHPDVLLLQEVTSSRGELATLLPQYPHIRVHEAPGPGSAGYAVLSRFRVTEVRPIEGLPDGARPADVVTVDVDGRQLTVVSVHFASPCVGCTPEEVDVNPAGSTVEAAELRVAEADRYAQVVSDLIDDGRAVVFGGDLNSSPLNRPLHILTRAGLIDAQRAAGTAPGLTRGPGPGLARVDVVLVAGLIPVRAAEGSRGDSTHAPVIADLVWAE